VPQQAPRTNSSDAGEEDTVSKRMGKVECSPSSGDDEEEDKEGELESYDDNYNDDKLDR